MTTKEVVTKGFILRHMDYKENDAILQVYTKEYGRIGMLAKGIKKMKSKNAAGCQTLTAVEITWIPRKGLSTLCKATPIQYYRHIKEDIMLEAYASYCCEFIYKFTEENDPKEDIYTMFIQTLDCLEQGYYGALVYCLYNAMILKLTGTPLVVDGCAYCHTPHDIVGISYTGGGFVCQNCLGEHDVRYDKKLLQAFRHINKCSMVHIDKLDIEVETIQIVESIMEQYIEEYTGMVFNSQTFIKQFRKL